MKHVVFLFIILFGFSCSTKKKNWTNRQYHNTTAKYNGYFNGNESLKYGIKKIHKNHKDDYSEILPVFPTGDLKKQGGANSYMDKAIQKGSIVIQRHSIKVRGREYCKWIDDNYLMVGRAYFYKGEFEEAVKTFSFIKNEYKNNPIRYEASLWLVRGYVEKGDFSSAEQELEELLTNKKLSSKLSKQLSLVASDLYIQKGDYKNAREELITATKTIKNKRRKVRLNYILAQLYDYSKNPSQAQKHYKIVLKSNPEYEMAFNAKMNLARSFDSGNPDAKKMKQKLLKMARDDKNKEYLDQIYYTIAEMEINSGDTALAIENYKLSALNSVENNSQKSLSFLALGKLYFSKGRYKPAHTNYDSTVFYMQDDFRIYEETHERYLVLKDLVLNIKTVEMEDSLQALARLPKIEQKAIIESIIKEEVEKERRAAEEKMLKQQMMYENNRRGGRGEQFGNKTSGGMWYFYNPATLSFGMSEFRKKWGKRKLEDDWRRKDKKNSVNFEEDTTEATTSRENTENNKDPNYYLSQLPSSAEDFYASDTKIKEALYQLGVIYKMDLNRMKLSNDNFLSIFKRYPGDKHYSPLALYNVYVNHQQTKNKEIQKVKLMLTTQYPNSVYSQMISNPNDNLGTLTSKDTLELSYQEIFSFYNTGLNKQVIIKTEKISDNKYSNKLLMLRALSFIRLNDISKAKACLQRITEQDEKIFEEAKYIVESINDPSKMKKANDLAVAGSSYLYNSNSGQMIIFVLPKEDVDITYLKTLISDFHAKKTPNEVFEISALLLGLDRHLLMVKSFDNPIESMQYYELLIKESAIINFLRKSKYKIMSISNDNFPEFYKNKDTEGYYNFFVNNYTIID